MRAHPPSRPLVSGYWGCLTLKFLSNQLNFVFPDCTLTPCFSWGWSRHLCVISACWESVSHYLLDINKTGSEFLGAVLIPDPFNPGKGLWHLHPVRLFLMYFSNSRSLSFSSWLFHLCLFCSWMHSHYGFYFQSTLSFPAHKVLPVPRLKASSQLRLFLGRQGTNNFYFTLDSVISFPGFQALLSHQKDIKIGFFK